MTSPSTGPAPATPMTQSALRRWMGTWVVVGMVIGTLLIESTKPLPNGIADHVLRLAIDVWPAPGAVEQKRNLDTLRFIAADPESQPAFEDVSKLFVLVRMPGDDAAFV